MYGVYIVLDCQLSGKALGRAQYRVAQDPEASERRDFKRRAPVSAIDIDSWAQIEIEFRITAKTRTQGAKRPFIDHARLRWDAAL